MPPFFTPSYEELRRHWKENERGYPIRQLALEVQAGRYALYELGAVAAEAHFYICKERSTIEDARRELGRIRWRLNKEAARIGPPITRGARERVRKPADEPGTWRRVDR